MEWQTSVCRHYRIRWRTMIGLRSVVRQELAYVAVVVGILAALHVALSRSFLVQSKSMEPTLLAGDVVVVEPVGKRVLAGGRSRRARAAWRKPVRDEVWVFRSDYAPGERHIKRIVGIEGDTLAIRNGELYVNSTSHRIKNYTCIECEADRSKKYNWKLLVVPPDSYFVMGDNPDQSMDSRHFGVVSEDRFVGRVLRTSFSYAADGSKPVLRRVRWSRLGRRVR